MVRQHGPKPYQDPGERSTTIRAQLADRTSHLVDWSVRFDRYPHTNVYTISCDVAFDGFPGRTWTGTARVNDQHVDQHGIPGLADEVVKTLIRDLGQFIARYLLVERGDDPPPGQGPQDQNSYLTAA